MNLQDVVPFQGLGDLRLGTARSEVQKALGNPSASFKKTPDAPGETDAYDDLGLHLYYDADDLLYYIEANPPSDPRYSGIPLLRVPLEETLEQLGDMGQHGQYQDEGYDFPSLGIALYVPDDVVESVSIFGSEYYAD